MLMYSIEHVRTEKTGTPQCFSVFLVVFNNQQRKKNEVAISHNTLEMKHRVGGNWRDLANDSLLECLKQHLGVEPVSLNQLTMMLADAFSYECVRTTQALIKYLPLAQQGVITAIAARRELEVQGLIDEQDD